MNAETYELRANLYRPRSLSEIRVVVRSMLAEGHSDYGIAASLNCAVELVRRLGALEDSQTK